MNEDVEVVVKVKDEASGELGKIDRLIGRLAAVASKVIDSIASSFANAGQAATDFGTKMLSGAASTAAMGAETTVATGGINLLVGALIAVAAAVPAAIAGFLALAPALLAAGGAAGAATTLIAGTAVALSTLKIGLGGISDAWNAYGKSAGGGGGSSAAAGKQAEAAARQVEAATIALNHAKRDEADAAKAVNQARLDEINRLHDLDMALRGQVLSQKEAAQALEDAKNKQRFLALHGNEEEKKNSALAVERAQYQYDSITDKLKETQAEKAKADKLGVEGSDKVQAALRRQADAHERTAQAAKNLDYAQKQTAISAGGAAGGVDQFAEAMSKLSPNARKLVMELISIKERFEGIKRTVQDRLLAGAAEAIGQLADKWLPKLGPLLGSMADKLNSVGKQIINVLGSDKFIKNIQDASTAFEGFLGHIGTAVSNLIEGFGTLAGNSGPVLEKIGEIIEDIATGFNNWIQSAEKSGALQNFMDDAADTLQDIYDIGKLAFRIVGQIIEILFPGSQEASNGVFDSVKGALQGVSDWLGDEKNQQKLKDFFTKVGEFFEKLVTEYIPDLITFGETVKALATPFTIMVGAIGKFAAANKTYFENVKRFSKSAAEVMVDQWTWVAKALKLDKLWDAIKPAFKRAINGVIDIWNSLEFHIPKFSFMGVDVGGGTIGTPNIGHFAQGGAGGGLAMVGERGRELVRLPYGSTVIPNNTTEQMMAGGSNRPVLVEGELKVDFINVIQGIREYVRVQGRGDVQRAFGSA